MNKVFSAHVFDVMETPYNGTNYQVVHKKKNAVAILAKTNMEEIIVVKQFRPAIEKEIWEVPAGVIEEGETPLQTALRELEEETGYTSDKAYMMGEFYSSPGFCDEKIYVVMLTNCTKVPDDKRKPMDKNEKIETKLIPWIDFQYQRFYDAKTTIAQNILGDSE